MHLYCQIYPFILLGFLCRSHPRNLKGESGLFLTPVLTYRAAAGYCSSRMEASYCTLRDLGLSFSMICARYHYHVIHRAITNNEYACVIWVYAGKVYSCVTKLFGGLSYEKIWRYNNSPPYMTARWPPQQIPPLNFLGHTRLSRRLHANRGYRLKSLGTDQLSK